jgi:hypothetical protein
MDIIIRPGEPEDKLSMPLYTRKRNFIPNEQRLESAPEILRAAVSMMQKNRPDALLRSITATYNCLGMAFASRRTHIDPMHLNKILRDDGYRLLRPDEAPIRVTSSSIRTSSRNPSMLDWSSKPPPMSTLANHLMRLRS